MFTAPATPLMEFQSTPPARGATSCGSFLKPKTSISIHAPREGGDKIGRHKPTVPDTFQSTPPARGATDLAALRPGNVRFQSTPPARGATSNANLMGNPIFLISIHAPREGGDGGILDLVGDYAISIHAPREGGDCTGRYIARPCRHFNPRPPRGGRRADRGITVHLTHFNPRPPRGGRLSGPHPELPAYAISIHAPREGGDMTYNRTADFTVTFQSTPPARGATSAGWICCSTRYYFNPRPPRGGRQYALAAPGQ